MLNKNRISMIIKEECDSRNHYFLYHMILKVILTPLYELQKLLHIQKIITRGTLVQFLMVLFQKDNNQEKSAENS